MWQGFNFWLTVRILKNRVIMPAPESKTLYNPVFCFYNV